MAPALSTHSPTALDEALAENAALRKLVAELMARIAELEAKLEVSQARAKQNSQNSSRPPSSDPPDVKLGPKKEPTGRKPGGQPGHKGHKRELLPPDKVSRFEDHWPDECEQCRKALRGRGIVIEVEPERHQVTDIPPVTPEVVEHRLHTVVCPRCDHATIATLPASVPRSSFGPRLVAIVALMAGGYRLSKRTIAAAVSDLFGVDMSVGAVSICEQSQSRAVAGPVNEAIEHVQAQPVVHADETGWTEARLRAWLWVAATGLVTVFSVNRRRSGEAARALLGKFRGILVTDRWSAYLQWPLRRRQLCWAHLKRDFNFIAERGGKAGKIGDELLVKTRQVFTLWHRVRDGTLSRTAFRREIEPLQQRIEWLLWAGCRSGHDKVAGMCREILKVSEAMWTFVRVPGVEPTNNLAERSLRHAVLWRKGSFGTHSAEGSLFVGRMLTVVTSLRQQKRHVLDYLTSANQAALDRSPAPSILPLAAA